MIEQYHWPSEGVFKRKEKGCFASHGMSGDLLNPYSPELKLIVYFFKVALK